VRIPKYLRVGARAYRLVVTPDLHCQGSPCWGLCETDLEQIQIDADALGRPAVLAGTLLHELLHALDKHLGLELSEMQVRRIGAGLAGVLLDNRCLREAVEEAAAHLKSTVH
jgi:hypothetical protein